MRRIELHSRLGSVTLAAIGAIYFVLAIALFAFFVVNTWNALSPLDLFLQLSLLGSALGGAYLFAIGASALRLRLSSRSA